MPDPQIFIGGTPVARPLGVVHATVLIGNILSKFPVIAVAGLKFIFVDICHKVGMIFEELKVIPRVEIKMGLGKY